MACGNPDKPAIQAALEGPEGALAPGQSHTTSLPEIGLAAPSPSIIWLCDISFLNVSRSGLAYSDLSCSDPFLFRALPVQALAFEAMPFLALNQLTLHDWAVQPLGS